MKPFRPHLLVLVALGLPILASPTILCATSTSTSTSTPTSTAPAAAAAPGPTATPTTAAGPAEGRIETPTRASGTERETRRDADDLAAGPWPQWRGPNRDGQVEGPAWPDDFSGLERQWRVELQPSYSGPIVTEDRVFTTETRDERFEVVSAYDRATGERLWEKQWEGSMKVPFFAARNGSWIRSTPAWDGETLFVGGIREVLVALDGETGEERWKIDFPARFGSTMPPFGFVCSPLLADGRLFVEAGGSVFELDPATGEVRWRSEPLATGDMTSEGTFSSPVLATLAGQLQLVVQSRQELLGLDVDGGQVLWRQPIPSFRGMNILTPLVVGDQVLTSTYRNATYLVEITRRNDGSFAAEEVWQNKAQAYMSSPVLVDDLVYLHLGNGRLTALDLERRQRLWTTKPFGPYWSMIARGDRILALDAEGELLLFRSSAAEHDLLDRRSIADSETWAHVALADDQIFVRELDGLSAWSWKAGTTSEPSPAEKAGSTAPNASRTTADTP